MNFALQLLRLVKNVSRRRHYDGEHELHTACSIGAAFFPDQGTSLRELYKAADSSLYLAKRHGRNTFKIITNYEPEIGKEAR